MNSKNQKIITISSYGLFLEQLKNRVQHAQCKASLAVNTELIQLYWDIGKSIVEKQEQEGWGAQIIEKLCRDLQRAFPGMQGFSPTNIFRMRLFYLTYANVPQFVGQINMLPIVNIPWGHNVLLIEKIKKLEERLDPYNFDFLTLDAGFRELELERGLVDHIQKLLLELGKGFAFIGRQYHFEIAGDDYYLNLLFYHIRLRCYCVVELKTTDFKPEYAGKLNFYLSAVDDQLKHKTDNPSIGILLCKSKNNLKVDYALRDIKKSIGVAAYIIKTLEKLPKKLQSSLPTIADIEAELMPNSKNSKKKKKSVIL